MGTVHILVFPYPAQGHMLALLDLTNQLLIRGGFSITIVVTPKNLPILSPLLSAHPSIQTLVLPFPYHPQLPVGVENIRDIGVHGNPLVMTALTGLAAPIAKWFHSHPSPPRAIISDFFLGWTVKLAQELHIPRIAFYSVGSFLTSVLAHLYSDIAKFKALDSVEFDDLPHSPVFKYDHLPSIFKMYNESDPNSQALKDGFIANLSSWGFIFNSYAALDGDYLEHFKKQTVTGRVYGVGPLSLFEEEEKSMTLSRVNPDEGADSGVLRWLQDCPDASVLYVSFGSQKWLTQPQLHALALALEKSNTRFVLVIQSGSGTQLLDRVGARGYVVEGWAPQLEILGHRAVGGFLSHCGWNSTLESVVAGVMVLAWPMEADQYVNARMLVEDLGVAVRACEGPDTVPDPDKLGCIIEAAMALDASQKCKARELKDKAVGAVREGGTSAKDLDEFVNQLLLHIAA